MFQLVSNIVCALLREDSHTNMLVHMEEGLKMSVIATGGDAYRGGKGQQEPINCCPEIVPSQPAAEQSNLFAEVQ